MARCWERSGVRKVVWEGQTHHSFRKGFVSGLRRLGADIDAIEYLVGHSAGIRGVYTDVEALPLREAVALIPRIGDTRVVVDIVEPPNTQKRTQSSRCVRANQNAKSQLNDIKEKKKKLAEMHGNRTRPGRFSTPYIGFEDQAAHQNDRTSTGYPWD